MRAGVVLVLAVFTCALGAAAAVASDTDRGRSRPPAALPEASKSIWMTEWVACRHDRLSRLAKQIGVKITAGRAPQVVATLIARKAEAPLYDVYDGFATAVDGCRNGILWRYYHES
jgi:hypothetical protein